MRIYWKSVLNDSTTMKMTMKEKKQVSKFHWTYGLLLSTLVTMILLSLPSLCRAEEELSDEFLQQKMEENGMEPGTSQVFKPPTMTDEERGSRHMPKHLRCAGCVAVAHQFEDEYRAVMKSRKKKLSLADQIDVAEKVCDKKLTEYGLKEDKGKKLLSGPGLAASDIAGMMEGGGKWEARMKTLCLELIEEYEEEGIYEMYTDLDSGNLSFGLCKGLCKDKDEILSLKTKDSGQSLEKSEL